MQSGRTTRWFVGACLAEASLLVAAVGLGWVLGQPALATLRWDGADAAAGVLAVLPMGVLFWWMLRSGWEPLAEVREFLDQFLRPVLGGWSVGQLLVISVIAGVAEEALFRSVLQGSLERWLPGWGALLAAGLAFGLCHAVTRAYAVIATLIGVYLGGLWWVTGNLLSPILAHALYDFVALVYFLRWRGR